MALNCVCTEETAVNSSEENLNKYIKEIFKYPNLSFEEEQETARLAAEGSFEAKQKLIKANLKLAVITAKKMLHTSGMSMMDLIQEGITGLMAAADKFNWKFGYRFGTYAVWWVKQAMFKAVSEQSGAVKIPVYVQETLARYNKIKADIEKETNRTADIEEIAKRMKFDSSRITNCLNANKKTLSLEGSFEMQNGSEVRLADIIEDKRSSLSSRLENEQLRNEITSILHELKDREQSVITMRFGLNGAEKQTLEEIGRKYGVTKECIRQTEARALNKLRNNRRVLSLYACIN